ncbi:MAG: SCO family protein [Firmicutes bacterium]|nr:SCO family protein [Bacillota bacterium]
MTAVQASSGKSRRASALRLAGVAATLLLLATAAWRLLLAAPPSFRGDVLNPPQPAPDFRLTDTSGRNFDLASLRGRVVLLYFGYTTCPDVCPATLAVLRQAQQQLGGDAARLRVLFVTVDPERDTPARVAGYLKPFGFRPAAVGLTGSAARLQPVWKAYGVYVHKHPVPGSSTYLVDHSAYVYLIDPQGRLRLLFPYGTTPEAVVHDVRLILAGR